MSKGIVFVLFVTTLFGSAVAAQSRLEKHRASALGNTNQRSGIGLNSRSIATSEARISVVRLREPTKAQRLYEKALKAWIERKPAEAQHRLDQALKIYPTFPEALTLYGGIQGSLQQTKAAEETLQSAIQIDPTYPLAYVVLAGVYNRQSRFDEAKAMTERALSEGLNTWLVQYEIARSLIGKKEYDPALTITQGALRKKHGALLHLAKAHALAGLKRYRQCKTELQTYLHDDPDGEGAQSARDLLVRLQSVENE